MSSSSSSSGIGFAGALTVAFVVLKLTGVIAWSWWWVLSPIWISAIRCVSTPIKRPVIRQSTFIAFAAAVTLMIVLLR